MGKNYSRINKYGKMIEMEVFAMSELINFRDFGGLPTENGKNIKKGIFYRSGSYRDLGFEDRQFIQSLGIQNLFDYREDMEQDTDEKQVELAETFHAVSASGHLGIFDDEDNGEVVKISDESMMDMYRRLPIENPAYKVLFEVLVEEDSVPLLHNCTAGKDRTGVASALVQLCLGATMDSVLLDYMKSMEAFGSIMKNERRRLNGNSECDLLHKLPGLIIKPSFLVTALESIINTYGSFDEYFTQEFGLDVEKRVLLMNKYTE